MAQRDRQHGQPVGLCKTFDHAKRRGGKLGQGRHGDHGDLHWKGVGIDQFATRRVAQIFGQHQRQTGQFGQGCLEGNTVKHLLRVALCRVEAGFEAGLVRVQTDALELLACHRRGKLQSHRPYRQAGGLGVFTFAGHAGAEGCAHLERIVLIHLVGNPAWQGGAGRCRDPLAVHQLHLGTRAETPVTCQREPALRFLGRLLRHANRLQQGSAILAVDQPYRNTLANALSRTPGVGHHRGAAGRTTEFQGEDLFFVNNLLGVGPQILYKWPAAIKFKA